MTEILKVSYKQIVESRWQPRVGGYDGENFDGLKKSIQRVGIINELKVFINEEGLHELVTGHRRLAASKEAGRRSIPVQVMADLRYGEVKKELTRFHEMVLLDNLFHEDLSPIEEARGIQGLMQDEGYTQEQAAKAMGKSQQWVSDRLGLLKLAPEVQQAVTERAVEMTVAQKLVQLPEDVQPSVMKAVKGQTSRYAGKVIKRVKEGLEPGFWDLPEDEAWTPQLINVKRFVDYCLEQVRTLTPDKMGQVMSELELIGMVKPIANLQSWSLADFAAACGLEGIELRQWLERRGHDCESCIWAEDKIWWDCRAENRKTCDNFMAVGDPIRLPAPESEQCADCPLDSDLCTDVSCYVEQRTAQSQVQEEVQDERDLEREIGALERLRAFYDRQQQEDVDCDHWLAQACEHCLQFKGPEEKEHCGREKPQPERTQFWTGPTIVPRCTAYRLRDLSRIPELSQSALREIMMEWVKQIGITTYNSGRLRWLSDVTPGKIVGFLKKSDLTQHQLGALVTMSLNAQKEQPSRWGDNKPVKFMDPRTGEYSNWSVLEEEAEAEELEEEAESEE